MKSAILLLLLFSSTLFAQLPNLVVSTGAFSPSSMLRGNLLTISVTVQNTGSANSTKSHVSFYLSKSKTIANGTCIGCVSVEPLAPGALSELKQIIIPVPPSINLGYYNIGWLVDPYNEVTESDETNDFYARNGQLSISSTINFIRHIPYPIILIHGLTGSDKSWSNVFSQLDHYGLKYGGRMDYCLNSDGIFETSVLEKDLHDFTLQYVLDVGDYYSVNFDVNPDGKVYNNIVESNQSAIYKQGKALQSAVKHVLDKTKAGKVILVGYCMGGLAAREYLQNSLNWQPDGEHHVAKVLTIGTPHGGSDGWTYGFEGVADEYSEAIRDLRFSYSNDSAGVFLFNGNEKSLSSMGYYNVDVNCNGVVGDNITGLNQKTMPSDIAYSCIIGTGGLSGDGSVGISSANLNNYYKINADTFLVKETHEYLPDNVMAAVKGLDEPSSFKQAYRVGMDSMYYGSITSQNMAASSSEDHDVFYFDMNVNSNLSIYLGNISTPQLAVSIYDSSYVRKFIKYSNTLSRIDTIVTLPKGRYYLEIMARPENYSWMFPYYFKLNATPVTGVKNDIAEFPGEFRLAQNYPNPFNPTTLINYSIPFQSYVELKIYDILGHEVSTLVNKEQSAGEYNVQFNASSLPSGMYVYTIQAGQFRCSKKLLLVK